MCFETAENFNRTSSGGVPIPSSKPSNTVISSNDRSILGSIWNYSKGVFNEIGSVELERYELKRTAALRNEEQKASILRRETLAGTAQRYLGYANTPEVKNTSFLIGAGLVGVAFILLVKGK